MHLQLNITSVVIAAFALAAPAGAQTRRSPHPAIVQTHFSAEDRNVTSPATIPPEIMAILSEDDMDKVQMENEEPRPAQVPHSWFSASKIRLGPTKNR